MAPTGLEGQSISHFQVLKKIGQGGMGEVYLAQDAPLDRQVALKFLPEEMRQDETARKRFLREAKSAAALDHPFICHIHEIGAAEGKDFIAMEYVEGQNLKDRLLKGPLIINEVLQIASEISQALEQAHTKNIVHRDLKPANIMLTADEHVKVMDFGLAKCLEPGQTGSEQVTLTRLTKEGALLGTVSYMSPEQLAGQDVDTRSDIFSFGAILYEMLAGVHPFQKAELMETASAILRDEAPLLSRYQDQIPEVLQHTVRKMLAKKPSKRYQSVHEIRTNLSALQQD